MYLCKNKISSVKSFILGGMESIELSGIGEIKVRRSANIKYLRIRMAPGRGIWVSVPYGVSR